MTACSVLYRGLGAVVATQALALPDWVKAAIWRLTNEDRPLVSLVCPKQGDLRHFFCPMNKVVVAYG